MSDLILALDQGTTGSTALLLDRSLAVRGKATVDFPQIFPQPGWVEHDPEAIWGSMLAAVRRALDVASAAPGDVRAIGITNQRETTLVWDRATGTPRRSAIVWQDRRTADRCAALKAAGHEAMVRRKTGLVLDPYFSGTKLAWMLDADPVLRRDAEAGKVAFGTVDSFLVARLSGGAVHVTDPSNASRTLLFDLNTLAWDDELCALLTVPRAMLPEVRASAEVYALTKGVPGLPDGIPIAAIAGDQQSALFGQACFQPGDAKCTYGTGAFLLMNTGAKPVASQRGLLTTVAWKLPDGEVAYALEGSAFIAGAAVQWRRDGLGIIGSAAEIEALAMSVPDAGGVTVVPAFAGLGAPHWRPEARGIITGLTRGTTRAHLARATLEGMALQIADLLSACVADAGRPLTSLKVDGGASANDLLMQFQADILGTPISRPASVETTAMGAAFLAGLATKVWPSKAAIADAWREQKRFTPKMPEAEREAHLTRWRSAVAKA